MATIATIENIKALVVARRAMKASKSVDEKFAALDAGLTEIMERMNIMKPKLTTAIATSMVDRIEHLKSEYDAEVLAIYRTARDNYAGTNNDSVIRDAVKAREELREAEYTASALLASFDADEAA